jgi:N-acetylmuramoyl-L-alanine amidase
MKKFISVLLPLTLVFLVFEAFIYPALFPSYVDAIAYKVGSKGSTVKQIEQKLKWLGLFKGTPDNYYGYDTAEAIKKLQRARGLKVDGIAGDRVLGSLGVTTEGDSQGANVASKTKRSNKGAYSRSSDVNLLARAINGEARGEPYVGQVAVGAVIVNRTRDPRFPHTIPGVIYQPGAFTAVSDGQINAKFEKTPLKAAQDALNGWDPTGGCVFYYNPAKTTNKWIWSRPVVKVIGKHYFCK